MASNNRMGELMLVSYEGSQRVLVFSPRLEEAKRTVLCEYGLDQQGLSVADIGLFLVHDSGGLFEFSEPAWARYSSMDLVVVKVSTIRPAASYAAIALGLSRLGANDAGSGNGGNGESAVDIEGWRRGGAAHPRPYNTNHSAGYPSPPISTSDNQSRRDPSPVSHSRIQEHTSRMDIDHQPLSRRTSFPVTRAFAYSNTSTPLPGLSNSGSSLSSFSPRTSPSTPNFARIGERLGLPTMDKRASMAVISPGLPLVAPSPVRRSASQDFLATHNVRSHPDRLSLQLAQAQASIALANLPPPLLSPRDKAVAKPESDRPPEGAQTTQNRGRSQMGMQPTVFAKPPAARRPVGNIHNGTTAPARVSVPIQAALASTSSGESAFSSDSEDEDEEDGDQDGSSLSSASEQPSSPRKLKSTPIFGNVPAGPHGFMFEDAILSTPPNSSATSPARTSQGLRRVPTSWPNSPISRTTALSPPSQVPQPLPILSHPSLVLGEYFASPTARPDSPMPDYCLRDGPGSSISQLLSAAPPSDPALRGLPGGRQRPRSRSMQDEDIPMRDLRARTINPPHGVWPAGTRLPDGVSSSAPASNHQQRKRAAPLQEAKRRVHHNTSPWTPS